LYARLVNLDHNADVDMKWSEREMLLMDYRELVMQAEGLSLEIPRFASSLHVLACQFDFWMEFADFFCHIFFVSANSILELSFISWSFMSTLWSLRFASCLL
jgi:hypothetical protein